MGCTNHAVPHRLHPSALSMPTQVSSWVELAIVWEEEKLTGGIMEMVAGFSICSAREGECSMGKDVGEDSEDDLGVVGSGTLIASTWGGSACLAIATDSWSMFLSLTKSKREGRPFNRGLKPICIN